MKHRIPTFVIIDPYLTVPETDAINTIQRILYKTTLALHKSFAVQILTPAHAQQDTAAALENLHPVGIISLGSFANVTDDHRWFNGFETLMKRWVLTERIPFLGICFTHQYVAKMFGAKVDFLKKRLDIKYGRFDGCRTFDILHPKLRLYFANLYDDELGLENKADLDFKEALRFASTLQSANWQVIRLAPAEHLHPMEARLRQFLVSHCPLQANFAVAHEQEVHNLPSDLVAAASSPDCQYEAFVSENQAFLTFQAHPEYDLKLPDGKRLIRNFIYSLCI